METSIIRAVIALLLAVVFWVQARGISHQPKRKRAFELLGGASLVFAVLLGSAALGVADALLTIALLAVAFALIIAAIFSLHLAGAAFGTALVVLAIASVSFIGIGMMTAVLPLISPEKGTQLGFMMQGVLLVVSGVYVSVDKLPEWMQAIATISPATYALEGIRAAIIDGASVAEVWPDIWPLLIIGVVSIPLGLWVFRRGEVYAKKHGKLKRSG